MDRSSLKSYCEEPRGNDRQPAFLCWARNSALPNLVDLPCITPGPSGPWVCSSASRSGACYLAVSLLQLSTSKFTSLCCQAAADDLKRSSMAAFQSAQSPPPCLSPLVPYRCSHQVQVLGAAFRSIKGQAPISIKNFLKTYIPFRSLWSESQCNLEIPPPCEKCCPRHFSCVLWWWNELLNQILSSDSLFTFKKHLKTHLFLASIFYLNVVNVAFLVIELTYFILALMEDVV